MEYNGNEEGDVSGRLQMDMYICAPWGNYEMEIVVKSTNGGSSSMEKVAWEIEYGPDQYHIWDTLNTPFFDEANGALPSDHPYAPIPNEYDGTGDGTTYLWPLTGSEGYYSLMYTGPFPPLQCSNLYPDGVNYVGCFDAGQDGWTTADGPSGTQNNLDPAEPYRMFDGLGSGDDGVDEDGVMTLEKCAGICSGYSYFGLESAIKCLCGNTLEGSSTTNCDLEDDLVIPEYKYLCSGDSRVLCGTDDKVSVYSLDGSVAPPPPPVTPTPVGDYDYTLLGCSSDSNNDRVMSYGPYQASSMSAEICMGYCLDEDDDFEYFGTEYSEECFCAKTLSDDLDYGAGQCTYSCAQNGGEICGGKDAISVYEIVESETAPSPVTPADTPTPPSPTPPSPSPTGASEYTLLGCSSDTKGARVMSLGPYKASSMSAEICMDHCLGEGTEYEYFGTEYSEECFCAETLSDALDYGAGECNYECAGNEDEICAVEIFVTPDSELDLTSVFSCEGGEFDVFWSGVVHVPGPIFVGRNTTVRVVGDAAESSSTSLGGSDYNIRGQSIALPLLPSGLTSAAVSTAFWQRQLQSNATTSSGYTDSGGDSSDTYSYGEEAAPAGSIFVVDGGHLLLENLAVRGGDARNYSTSSGSSSIGIDGGSGQGYRFYGGGVYAVDASVAITRCEFENNFAQNLGGGIYANRSTLVVIGSVFRRCQADVVSSPGDDANGAGGGIGVENTDVLIDGTLFNDCYASKRGGGFHQEDGYISVMNSAFHDNIAGSSNEEAEDPVGEGGAISFVDCRGSFDGLVACGVDYTVFVDNHTAQKGGAVMVWSKSAPSQVELRRCTFENSTTGEAIKDDPQGEGGAVTVGASTTMVVTESLFMRNVCGKKGGVINMSNGDDWEDGAVVVLRSSTFKLNQASLDNGGVVNVGSYGLLLVEGLDNVFSSNWVSESGGVFAATTDTRIILDGGEFSDNEAYKGGVVWTRGNFTVMDGVFRGNLVVLGGGVVYASEDSSIALRRGVFTENRAKDGGVAQVESGSALLVEGGEYSENFAATNGGVLFSTDGGDVEVTFNATVNTAALAAVEVDELSSYKAEETTFVGDYGLAAVYSKGTLFLDDCDFCDATGELLVKSDGQTPVIRNAILGDRNYLYDELTLMRVPMINVNVTCEDFVEEGGGGNPPSSPCSEGSTCLNGDLGVYCLCYMRESTSEQTCVGGDPQSLHLTTAVKPATAFYPEELEGYLALSLDLAPDTSINSDSSAGALGMSSSIEGTGAGVLWNISTLSVVSYQDDQIIGTGLMDWMAFPANGLLLPGQSITVRVVSLPSIDGLVTVNFGADGRAFVPVDLHGEDDTALFEISQETAAFDAEFYHCEADQLWCDFDDLRSDMSSTFTSGGFFCARCIDAVEAGAEGLDCSAPGATVESLPIKEGYWRASLDSLIIHECFIKDACKGGSDVVDVVEYCNDGYAGPQCAVCASGYAGGVGSACHECTDSFKAGAYFVAFFVLILAVVVAALQSVYLVGGKGAVSTTKAKIVRSVSVSSHRFESSIRGASFVPRAFSSSGGDSSGSRTVTRTSSLSGRGISRLSPSGESKKDGSIDQLTLPDSDNTVHGVEATLAELPPSRPIMLGDTYAAGRCVDRRNQASGRDINAKKTYAARVAAVLAALPLSKLKIVVVVWQISNAFAEVTNAPFPPVYNKFLSIIGVFSFDLGWMLSAACLVTNFSFYDKLL
eukprot:g6941.t1